MKGVKPSDLAKGFSLAGFSKAETQAALKNSKFENSMKSVVEEFGNFNMATTGIKGKFNTMKDGAEKLGKALKTKVTTGAKGAWGALKKVAGINPLLTAGVIAAGAGFGAYKLYQAHKDNRLQDASEDADKWQSKNKSLSEQITQYDSLKSQLDAGTASAQEEYNIRSQILEIQNEITNAYGDQAAGIDLVNGSLDKQKAKLEEIRQEKADEFIRDNSSGIFSNPIKDAKKAMETEKNNHIADSIGEDTKQYTLLQKAINRTNQKLKEQGFTGGSLGLEKNSINGTYSLDYKGNAENSKTVQTALQKELKEIAQDTDSTELFEDIQANIDNNIRSADKTIDKYGDFYKQVREAELINDTTKYGKNKKGNGGKIATEWLSDYEDAVNKYNEAFSSGEQETIDSAKKNYDDFYSKLPKDLKEKYAPEIKEITDGLDTEAINKNDFVQALKGTDQYAKGFTKTAQELKKLNLTEDDVYGIFNSTDMKDSVTKGRLVALRGIAEQLGIIDDISSSESIQKFIEALGDAGIITASDHIDTTALSAEQLATKVEAAQTALSNINSVISASNSDSGLLTDNITALEESFGGLDSYNAESLLSNTADGVKLNTTALKGLIVQQHKADSDDLEARIKGQNEELQKQKDILNDVTQSEDNKQNAKEQIDSITDAIERMKQAQSQLYASYKQQMELTSDYQAVLDAESTPNAGARYDNMKSKVKTAKEAFDKGEIGTDDFKTVARYLSPNGFEDPENFAENYQKAKRYLTDDSSGVINFLQDLQSKGLATMTTLADGTHEWTTSFDDAAEASKQAGMGYEFFMDMFGKAEDYGAFNTFISSAEEGELKVQDLSKQLAEAKTRMAELQSQGADESSLQGQQKVVDELEAKLGKQQGVLDDYYGSYKQKQAQQLEDAKEQLDLMSNQIKNESNQNVKDFLIANFKQLAKEYGLDYNYDENSGNISVDNDAYKDQMSQYGNTWVNPASAKDMGYKEGTQEAKDYQAAVDSLTAAHKKNDTATEEAFKTLSQYNAEELKGIELDNNKYDSDDAGLRKAEDALQMLSDTYGLTKDQLLEGLEGLGQLKLDVDTSSMENLKHEATEAQEKLNEITGKTYKFNFDTSNLNTIRQQIEQAKEQLSQFQFTDSTGKKRVDYSQNGAKEATTVYAASIKQEQDAEYSNSNIGKVDTSSVEGTTKECITAAQEFMQAKNEMDVQTQLAQEGATNTLDQASQKCQQAYETFKNEATENGIKIDTSDIQTAEDELLTLSGEDLSTKFNVDVSDLNTALTDVQQLQTDGKLSTKIDLDIDANSMSIDNLESKIQELSKEQTKFTIDGDVEDAEKVQALIDLLQQIHDKKVQVTAETQGAELVDQLQARISELQGKGVTIDAIVQDDQVSQLVNEIAQLPPEVQIAIGVDESNVGNVDAIKSQIEANPASITVNYKKGDEPKKADDISGKANYTLGEHPTEAPTIQGTANYTLGSYPKTAPTIYGTAVYTKKVQATGSMTSIAHADGTAYNMLNLKPLSSAHAGGNVALGQNETALTNEVGTESIVRDGVWSLLPGGPHMENLKKGDIIFSASQTEDLLKHGKTNSHARAYANGTLAVSPAHVGGPSTTGYSGLNDKYLKKSSSRSNNSSSNSSNRSSSKSGSSNSSRNSSSSSSSKWEDPWKNVVDWFERLVTKFENRIDLAQSRSENATALSTKNNYLTRAINYSNTLMSDYVKGRQMYVRASNRYANKVGLSSRLVRQVQNGTIDIESLDENTKSKVEAYQKWYDKIVECDKAIEDLKSQEKDLYKQRLDNVTEKYDALKSVYENQNNTLSSLNEWASEIGNSEGVGSGYYQNIITQRNNQSAQTNLITSEIKEYQAQLNQIRKKYGVNSTFYKESLAGLEDLKTALNDSKKATAELTNQLYELAANAAQYKTDKYTRASEKQSAYRDYKDANRYYNSKTGDFAKGITESDYRNAITTNYNTIKALQEQKNLVQQKMLTVKSGSSKYQEYADQLADLDKKILETANDNASLKKSIVDLRFEQFDDAQDKLDDLIEDYGNLRDMMDSDTFYDSDTGAFTKTGLANVSLINKEMDVYKQKISDCTAELDRLESLKKNGMLTADEYKERSEKAMDEIRQASKSLYSDQQSLLDMYTNKISTENDLLKDNIDKRKEAFENKRDYYEFDKTLKDKNKDINALKAQIAALEGTTNASAKARLAQLKADLKDKEDDLADTKYQHQLDMESKGYDNLSDQADDALDKTLNALKSNTDFQKSVINNMLAEVKKSYKDTFEEISKIIEDTGYKTSTLFKDKLNADTIKNSTNETVNDAKKHPGSYTNVSTSGVAGDSKANTAVNGALKDSESAGKAANDIGYDQNGKSYSSKLTLSLSPKSVTIYVGKKQTVKVNYKNAATDNLQNFTATVKDSSIATVQKSNNNSFIVTAKKSGRTTVTVHPVVSSATAVTLNVTVRQNNYNKYAKTVDKVLNRSGYKFSDSERQSIKDSLIVGKSDKELSNTKNFNARIQNAIKKNQLTKWYKSLTNRTFKSADYVKRHALIQHFNKKGKAITGPQLVNAAKILGLKYSGNYNRWTNDQKNTLLKKLQAFGFSKGGVVRQLIPADANDLIGKAIIKNGDTGFITARAGETVLTEEFTKQLKPTVQSMNAFNEAMSGKGISASAPKSYQNQNITFNPEITVNVDSISNDLDIKQLGKQLSDVMYGDFTKRMRKDLSRSTGRNR